MKIIMQQSGHGLGNMGDLAMLQIAVARLTNLWPDATIKVFTTRPDRLLRFCPQVIPLVLPTDSAPTSFLNRCQEYAPKSVIDQLEKLRWQMRHRTSVYARPLAHSSNLKQANLKQIESIHADLYEEVVRDADLVVTSGGGYMTDSFEGLACSILNLLELAIKRSIPTAMLGQGLGPVESSSLFNRMKTVLPCVNLITLREKRSSISLLNALNVPQSKNVLVTGDDAIELAYTAQNTYLSNGIGINLRMAGYAEVDITLFNKVRRALHDAAWLKSAPLIPIPIAQSGSNSDIETIQRLRNKYDGTLDQRSDFDTPAKVIEQVARCRVVVTGSYHAGVFALSRGIPVICLAKSRYYIDKFLGLADQFGIGCEVICLNSEKLHEKLISSIDRAWRMAEQIKPQLLESAKCQITSGHSAYQQLYELVKVKNPLSSEISA